jgi:uracil-DNA glycosylase
MAPDDGFARLLSEIRGCVVCAAHLPLGPRPIVRGSPASRLLIISQAPGTRVHETGLSFNDKSGDRLRQWMGIDGDIFYDESQVAVMGMGFCYPGREPNGGDLPPRPECAPLWHSRLRVQFAAIGLTLLVGGYAIRYYLPENGATLGAIAARWREFLPEFFVLPHPSWRTTGWDRTNPWFAAEALPELKSRVATLLNPPQSAPCPRR